MIKLTIEDKEWYVDHAKMLKEKQEKCSHEYPEPVCDIEYEDGYVPSRRCKKCGYDGMESIDFNEGLVYKFNVGGY